MTLQLTAFVFMFGAVIGSFLNAVLWRLHTGESFVKGRSYCPSCEHALSAKDLVPIVSWLILGGRCRYCRKGISASYLLIELATGLLFVAAAYSVFSADGASAVGLAGLLFTWYLLATLVLIFVFDLRHMLILRAVTVPATVLALAGNLALGANPLSLGIGMLLGGGIFWLQYVLSKGKWIGGGDIQLGILMGAMLGWRHTLAAVFLAYIVGAFYGVIVLASGRKEWKSEIPFGTFLSAATAAMLLWGERIIGWYLGLML